MAEVVTSENLMEFQLAGLPKPEPKEEPKAEEKVEEKAEEKEEEPKEEEHKPKRKLEQRFSELTEARRRAEERAEAAERKAAELEAKINPKPVEKVDNDIGPEPKQGDYTDAFEYAKDLAKWSADKALKDHAVKEAEKTQKAEAEKVLKAWQKRVTEIETELPDYKEVLASAEDLSVSDEVRDALIESELGPRILYHLASNPEEVAKLNEMTVRGAVRYIGKLEAKFEKAPEKEQKPEVKVAKVRPPEPITPIKTSNAPENKINSKGEFQGSYAEWKALRAAGKV